MGTEKTSRAPTKKSTKKSEVSAAKARLSSDQLRQAVRTLAAMAACYEKPNPMIRPRKGGGADRILEAALAAAVMSIEAARKAQAALATRAAEMLLLDTLSSAISALREETPNFTEFRVPVARMGSAPAVKDNSPGSILAANVRRACDVYSMMTDVKIGAAAIDEVVEQLLAQREAELNGATSGGNLAHEMMDLLVAVSESTLQKRRAERRQVPAEEHEKLRWSLLHRADRAQEAPGRPPESEPLKFPFGDLGYFFGASRAPTCGDLAAMLGGPAFLANALAELGPEMAMRCAVYAYEANGLREMAMHRMVSQTEGAQARSAEFVAARAALHEAVARMAVALGGESSAYQPQMQQGPSLSAGGPASEASAHTLELKLNAAAVYPGEWVVFQSVLGSWARATGV